MIVRTMRPGEIDVTVNLCRYYGDEAKIPDEEYDTDAVVETIRTHTVHPEYVWLNAYDGTRPVGLIAGCVTKKPWSKVELVGHIELVFLLESHRTMPNFKQLLDKFEEWARSMKCQSITAGDIGINVDRTRKLFQHFDYTEGLWMSKELT